MDGSPACSCRTRRASSEARPTPCRLYGFAMSAEAESAGPRLVADNPGLVAVGIGKSFKKRPVVRGVSLNLRRGEAVGLLGPNGAGKTTCFYIITGLIAPDYGSIHLD